MYKTLLVWETKDSKFAYPTKILCSFQPYHWFWCMINSKGCFFQRLYLKSYIKSSYTVGFEIKFYVR